MQAGTHRTKGLHGINLTAKDGECVLLCWKSGCGRTTMIRPVSGLIPDVYLGKLAGNVLLDGQGLSELPVCEITSLVGSVFQNLKT